MWLSSAFSSIATALPENNRLERIWLLAKTDFRKRYNDSFLGLLWALINPLAQLAIYFYIFTVVFHSRTENFILFLFVGIVFWQWFVETTKRGITLIPQKRYLLENVQINRLDIYYAGLLSTFMGFLFNFCVYFLCSLFFDVHISGYIVFLPILILNMAVLILAVQIILSIIHVFIRDIEHVWALATLVLFWLSGILFEVKPDSTWKTALLAYLTPILGILNNVRAVLIFGEDFNWRLFIYDWGYSMVLLLIAWRLISRYFSRAMEIL